MKSKILKSIRELKLANEKVKRSKKGKIVPWQLIKQEMKSELAIESGNLGEDDYRRLTEQYFSKEPVIKEILKETLELGYSEYRSVNFDNLAVPLEYEKVSLEKITEIISGKMAWVGFHALLKNGSVLKGSFTRDLTIIDVTIEGDSSGYWQKIIAMLNETVDRASKSKWL